jgi:hypothetical protein
MFFHLQTGEVQGGENARILALQLQADQAPAILRWHSQEPNDPGGCPVIGIVHLQTKKDSLQCFV